MNRKEFTEAVDRIEALVNKFQNLPLEEKVALLSADRDLSAIRRVGREGYRLKAAADRLFQAVRDYVRRTDDEHRKAVFTEIDELRLACRIEVRE
jgi:hypothetical protein